MSGHKHPQATPPKKNLGERVADLERRVREMDASILVQSFQTMAMTILAHAVARTAGLPTTAIKAEMDRLVATLPEALRPTTQLDEIKQILDMAAQSTRQ